MEQPNIKGIFGQSLCFAEQEVRLLNFDKWFTYPDTLGDNQFLSNKCVTTQNGDSL